MTTDRRHGVRNRRAIVSVAFRADEFAKISEYAESIGEPTSTAIRRIVLKKLGMPCPWCRDDR